MYHYFIDYAKHNLFICCDDNCCYINLVISEYDGVYVLIPFIYSIKNMNYGIKQVIT